MTSTFADVDALSFDCYGTLIDWEDGIDAALGRLLRAHGVDLARDDLLEAFARHEASLEAGPFLRYRDLLAAVAAAICAEHGVSPDPRERRRARGSCRHRHAFFTTYS